MPMEGAPEVSRGYQHRPRQAPVLAQDRSLRGALEGRARRVRRNKGLDWEW